MDARRTSIGVESDHSAIKLKMRFVLNKSKRKFEKKKEYKKRIDWSKLACQETAQMFANKVDEIRSSKNTTTSKTESITNTILEAAQITCTIQERPRDDWFSKSKEILLENISQRNYAYKKWSKEQNELNKIKCQHTRATLRRTIIDAKNFWLKELLKNYRPRISSRSKNRMGYN